MSEEERKELRQREAELNHVIALQHQVITDTNSAMSTLMRERRHIQELLREAA